MTVRLRILIGVLLGVTLLLTSGQIDVRPNPVPDTRRHVLLLTVETLRADHVDCDGAVAGVPSSPTLARLVERGHAFPRAVTPVPRTTPAVASLLTGAYPHTTGVRALSDNLLPDVVSVAELFRARGYETRAVVSNHVLLPARGLDRGFTRYDHSGDGRDAATTTRDALTSLDGLDADDLVFLWVHYIDPHMPYAPTDGLAERFDPGYRGRYATRFGGDVGATGPLAFPRDLLKTEAIYRNPLPEAVNEHIRLLYAADVRGTDDAIAELLAGLRERFGDQWSVIFTADHGESLGEHDYYWEHGDYVWNETVRVPLAISLPAGDPLAGASETEDWVSLVDVAPTLVELFDLPLPYDLSYAVEGRSLVPYLRGETLPERPVFAESGRSHYPHEIRGRVSFDVAGRFRATYFDRWKLIFTPGAEAPHQLYDMESDPGEQNDLAAPKGPQVAALRRHLDAWMREVPESTPAAPSEEDLSALRALGYID